MSERDPPPPGDQAAEPFLARWSRRKAQARSDVVPPEAAPAIARDTAPEAPGAATPATATPAPIELPNLDLLDQDADYSAFLTPGVDGELRRRALRKLFHSPKFNVFDGLDTYRDDYTQFPALGEVVTADMKHHLARLADQLTAEADAPPVTAAPAALAAPVAATAGPEAAPDPQTPPTTPGAAPEDDARHDDDPA